MHAHPVSHTHTSHLDPKCHTDILAPAYDTRECFQRKQTNKQTNKFRRIAGGKPGEAPKCPPVFDKLLPSFPQFSSSFPQFPASSFQFPAASFPGSWGSGFPVSWLRGFVAGQPVAGQPVEPVGVPGQPVAGQPVGPVGVPGQPVAGQPVEPNGVPGQPVSCLGLFRNIFMF